LDKVALELVLEQEDLEVQTEDIMLVEHMVGLLGLVDHLVIQQAVL
jgi:hypothetical protein